MSEINNYQISMSEINNYQISMSEINNYQISVSIVNASTERPISYLDYFQAVTPNYAHNTRKT